jgi:hypothetical protein
VRTREEQLVKDEDKHSTWAANIGEDVCLVLRFPTAGDQESPAV